MSHGNHNQKWEKGSTEKTITSKYNKHDENTGISTFSKRWKTHDTSRNVVENEMEIDSEGWRNRHKNLQYI